MAEEIQIPGSEGIAKVRHPVAVPLLTLVTLGIYGIYWWYQVNREMRDFGASRGDQPLADSNPTNSLLAIFPGGLIIIPPLFSYYNGYHRTKRAQALGLGGESINGWLILILFIVGLSIVGIGYWQAELNKVWQGALAGGQPAGEVTAGTEAPAPPAAEQPAGESAPGDQT